MTEHITTVAGRRRRHPALDRWRTRRASARDVRRRLADRRHASSARSPAADAAEADAAVAAARAGVPGLGRARRRPSAPALLHAHRRRRREAASRSSPIVETADNGALLRSHRRGVMPRVAHNFRFFADWLRRAGPRDFDTRGHRNHVSWDPAGPVRADHAVERAADAGHLEGRARRSRPGNTVVLKPAEWSPLTASLLADIAAEAGLPAGVLNVVQGFGAEVGAALVAHPDVRRISFTGSVPTARHIAAAAAANLTPSQLRAGRQVAAARLRRRRPRPGRGPTPSSSTTTPARCASPAPGCSSRRRSPRSSPRRFLDQGARAAPGRPARRGHRRRPAASTPTTSSGSTASSGARSTPGATALLGGGPNTDLGGLYYRPDPAHRRRARTARSCSEEVFGPVLTLQTFDTEDEAVALANDTHFGLAAMLVTGDRGARRAGQRRGWSPARSGSTASSCATCAHRSAAPGSPASAARAAPGASTSTATSRTPSTRAERDGRTMGEVVGAGLLAHVPTIMLPEDDPPRAQRAARRSPWSPACERLRREVFERLDYDTVVVLDSHWATTVEFVVTAQPRRAGLYTSEELPRGMCRMPYDFPGDPELAHAIAGVRRQARHLDHRDRRPVPADPLRHRQPVEVPRRGAGQALGLASACCQTADTEDLLRLGRALARRHRRPRTARCC